MNWFDSRISHPGKSHSLSPLGWSAGARLIWAVAAATFLWLSVAWALGW